ncbi:MAG TPA: peptide ABC transporter substrate-binding protein [Chloroflexota bacterium]|jgi:ABC-type transport system substrate-binding protein
MTRKTVLASRRRFLAGGAAAASAVLLAACAPAAAPTAAPTAAPKPAAEAPKPTEAPKPAAEAPKPTEAPKPAAAEPTKPAAAAAPTNTAAPAAAAKPAEAGTGEKSDFGVAYPADAAPKDKQFTQAASDPKGQGWKSFDFNDAVYARAPNSDLFSEPLVRIDKNWQILPGQASKWEVSPDGKSWTFFLDKGQMWSNGDEVTADDYVATFRYTADPKHAWDFTWYWDGIIKNYGAAVKGKSPINDIGVKVGADKYQVVFETEDPTPFLPQMLLYSWPLHAKSLEKNGSGIYQTNPATCVSCGPYVLEEFSPDRRVTVKANAKYTGKLKPLINRWVANVVTGGSDFARYQAGEIDTTASFTPADLKLILADPTLKAQFKTNPGDFRTFYMFWDVTKPPFDNKSVRLAFAKAIDRESIIKGILAPLASPAYSFLMPGFPDANSQALKPIQDFNPTEAKKLLAEAGFPNGQGFPKQTMLVRGGTVTDPAVTQAVIASIKQTLGVDIDLQTKDSPAFMADLNAKPTKVTWGWLSYGMDYFDATNMLGVWKGGGRHNWNNAAFDKLVKDGGQITDNPEKRSDMMKQAEKLLVEDAPGAFVYHQLVGQLHKPYRKGDHLAPNKYGYDGAQWPGESTATPAFNTLYMGKEVLTMRK